MTSIQLIPMSLWNSYYILIMMIMEALRVLRNSALLNRATLFRFSQTTTAELLTAAIASSEVIKQIALPTESLGTVQGCLGARIKELVSKPAGTNDSNQADKYKDIRNLFIEGTQLQDYYLSQDRLTDARTISDQSFIFYPTSIVTSKIFQFLRDPSRPSQIMYTGDKGVGKTTSFILYAILMNNITRYAMSVDAATAKQQIKEGKILKPQKFLYWNYNPGLKWKTIIDQCPQIYMGNKAQHKYQDLIKDDPYQFQGRAQQIKLFYEKHGIYTVVIVDQINALASEYRNFNGLVAKGQFKNDQAQADYILQKRQLRDHNRVRNIIARIGKKVIYNSSVTIEQELLGKPTDYRQTMSIATHSGLDPVSLNYKFRSRKEESVGEFIYYAGLEFQRHYPHLVQSDVEQLWTHMKQWKLTQSEPLLVVRQTLKTIKQRHQQIKQVDELWTKFKTIMEKKKKKKFQKLKNFIEKRNQSGDAKEHEKMFFLMSQINLLIKDQPSSSKENIWIKRKDLFQLLKGKYSDIREQEDIDRLMDLSIFAYSDNEEGYLCPLNITALKDEINNRAIQEFYTLVEKDFDFYNVRQQPAIFGYFTEYFIMKSIAKQQSITLPGFSPFFIGAKSTFIQLNQYGKGKSQQDYTNRFKEMIEMAMKMPLQFIYGEPQSKHAKDAIKSSKSYCIDFGFVRYDPQRKKPFQFVFVDVKTGQQFGHKQKNQDCLQFKNRLAKALPKLVGKYSVQIIVLCPETTIPKAKESKNYKNVTFADISKFQFHTKQLSKNVQAARSCLKMLKKQ